MQKNIAGRCGEGTDKTGGFQVKEKIQKRIPNSGKRPK